MALKPLAHLTGSSKTDYDTKIESIIDCRINGSVKMQEELDEFED